MKVLHICMNDKAGGAAIAAFRHCEAMQQAGIDASFLVTDKQRKYCPFIYQIIKKKNLAFLRTKLGSFFHRHIINKFCTWGVFSFPLWSFHIHKHPLVNEADIIYLHWVAGGMLSTKEIKKIFKTGKKVIWYMHDMNPITGGCHYAMNCNKYTTKNGCHDCPFLRKRYGLDLAKIQWKRRFKNWSIYKNCEIMTPSNWLANCAKESTIWKTHKVSVVPNVINTKKFKPLNKKIAKELFNLDYNKHTILFGADSIKSDYKGWNYLKDALNKLDPNKYELIVFGEKNQTIIEDVKIKCFFTGFLQDELSLIMAYNAADTFITPSLADNYPNVILEAMSCGVPCIGFKTGGIPDLIHHEITGLLTETGNTDGLANCIERLFKSNEYYTKLTHNARMFVQDNCDYSLYNKYRNNLLE